MQRSPVKNIKKALRHNINLYHPNFNSNIPGSLMIKVMHRHSKLNLATIAAGNGAYMIDTHGNKYLDACGGAAVSCLGHSNERVKTAIIEQVKKIPYAHTSFFTNEPQEKLADNLLKNSKGDFAKIYFVSGGSEAVESAMKLARQYFVESGKYSKRFFIARAQSYHGNTLGALSIGGNMWRRKPFESLLVDAHHIPACYEYRGRFANESAFAYGQRIANTLEDKILELGAENVAAFVAETVVGATAGAVPPVPGYFKRIREICDKYEVLLILDEVMCGMGRTGTLHACEQDEVQGDLQTVAKGIAAGYQPLGAVFVSSKIAEAIHMGSGFFQHGHTYIGHPVTCAAGLATQLEIEEHGLLQNVTKQGELLKSTLEDKFNDHPHIGDIRGRGLFIGLELVEDKAGKIPFDNKLRLNALIKNAAMGNLLMVYAMGGTIDGESGDHVLLAPPFIIDEANVGDIVDRLYKSINTAISQIK